MKVTKMSHFPLSKPKQFFTFGLILYFSISTHTLAISFKLPNLIPLPADTSANLIKHTNVRLDSKNLNQFIIVGADKLSAYFSNISTPIIPTNETANLQVNYMYQDIISNEVVQKNKNILLSPKETISVFFPLFKKMNYTDGSQVTVTAQSNADQIIRGVFAQLVPVHSSIDGWKNAGQIRKATIKSIENVDYSLNRFGADVLVQAKVIKVLIYNTESSKAYGSLKSFTGNDRTVENDELRFLYITVTDDALLGLKVLKVAYEYTFWLTNIKDERSDSRSGVLFEVKSYDYIVNDNEVTGTPIY